MRTYALIFGLMIALVLQLILIKEQTNAAFCVGGGGLSITSLPSPQIIASGMTKSANEKYLYTYIEPIEFEDMRGKGEGFSLTVSGTDFRDADKGKKIDITNLSIISDANNALKFIDCNDATGIMVTQTSLTPLTDSNDDGTSDNLLLFEGDARIRLGQYKFQPQLEFTIPAYTPRGRYDTSLTFTLF